MGMSALRLISIRKLEELQFQMEEEAVKKTDKLKVSKKVNNHKPVSICVLVFV